MEPEGALPDEVRAAVERLDALVKRFEEHPEPAGEGGVAELLQCVDTIHRAGLRRIAELLQVAGLERRALDDPEVRLLFDLYDLGEGGEQVRADAVLQTVRPELEGYGAGLELIEADRGSVRLRVSLPPEVGAQGAEALRGLAERAFAEALPGVKVTADLASPPAPTNFVPLTALRLPPRPTIDWQSVLSVADIPEGCVHALVVDDEPVLLAKVGGEVYAYRNACPGSPMPLESGRVEDGVLACPWHGCRFDLRGGRRVDRGDAPGLGVVPVRVEDGEVRVGIARSVAA